MLHLARFLTAAGRLCACIALSALAAWGVHGQALAHEHGVLVLGRISDDPAAHYHQLQPLLDYVVPRMADVGIREGRILMAQNVQQMQSYLRRGRVDWVTETSASAMLLKQRADAVPLLLTERSGVGHYRTLYFTRRDSGIASLQDLRGRSIAFQNSTSTSAYFVPATELLEAGLRLEILLSPDDRLPPDLVGFLFARSQLNLASWVHKGLVDAGAMSNLDWNNEAVTPRAFRDDFVVFRESRDYPRALEIVRADLDPAIQRRLREVLLAAADDPHARDAMRAFFGTTRFLPLDAASEAELERLRRGALRVVAEVE